jgi:uncharacterized RDD family membrane protein YckC
MEQTDAFAEPDFAPFGARVLAYLIDTVIFVIVLFAVFVGLALASADDELHLEGVGMLTTWVVTSVIWEVLWICGPSRSKPGQRILGFRVLALDGSPVAPGRAAIRCVVRIITIVAFPFGLIAQVVTLGASARNQGVHDVFAATVCVRRSAIEQAHSVQHMPTEAQRARPTAPPAETEAARHQGPFM